MTSHRNNNLTAVIAAAAPLFPYRDIPTKDGVPTLQAETPGRKLFLHSSIHPLREAERAVSALNIKNDVVVIAGFGLGYETEAILRRLPPRPEGPVLLILEKDAGLLKTALSLRPELNRLFDEERVQFFLDPAELLGLVHTIPSRRLSYFFHRPSCELFPDFFRPFRDQLLTFVQKKNINIATLSRFEKIWAVNLASNIPCFIRDPGVARLADRFPKVPAVLAGAGPSLDTHIGFLRKIRNKCLLVAVDASFRRLLSAGIEPDIVFSVDPQIINYYFFRLCGNFRQDSLLVYEPSCHHLIPSTWKGRRMTFDSIFPLVEWISSLTGGRGRLDMGGSVSTSAFDLILTTGADPVILIGQDMAFDRERTHASGSLVEYVLQKRNHRTDPFDSQVYRLSHSRITVTMKSNTGGPVLSDRRLLLFCWWFRDKMKSLPKGGHIFTLAENGAAVDGISWISEDDLEKKLADCPDFRFPKDTGHPVPVDPGAMNRILKESDEMTSMLNAIARLAEEAMGLSQGLYESVKNERTVSPTVLKRLDEIDRDVKRRQEANQFLSMTMQKAIFSITEGHEDFLTEEEIRNRKLGTARRSVLLYEALLKSARLNRDLLRRMIAALEDPAGAA